MQLPQRAELDCVRMTDRVLIDLPGMGPLRWSRLGELARACLHTVIPASCASCNEPLSTDAVPLLCDPCRTRIRPVPLSMPRCPRCGRPFVSTAAVSHSPTHHCGTCRSRKPAYTKAYTLYAYESPLREAIHALKYQGKLVLAPALGELLVRALPKPLTIDYVIPVPLGPARLRSREFNQSLLLARQVAQALGVPLDFISLQRRLDSPPQTSLSRRARLVNLRRAFHVEHAAALQGKRILLVDDVMTTGTTVNECAKTLRKSGSGDVYVATLARTIA